MMAQQRLQVLSHHLFEALGRSSLLATTASVPPATVAAASAEGTGDNVSRLVFLSHPFAWELEWNALPDQRWGGFTMPELVAIERKVSSRWVAELEALDPRTTVVIINYTKDQVEVEHGSGPCTVLSRAARAHFGMRLLELYLTPPTNYIGRQLGETLAQRGLMFDPDRVETEAWGQSTEGCVQWFASHYACGLWLPRGFPIRYDLTVPDAPFCMLGRFVQRLSVPHTDISGYVFESAAVGRQPFVLLAPGVMRDQQRPRVVRLRAPTGSLAFTNKQGVPLSITSTQSDSWTASGEQMLEWEVVLPNHTMDSNQLEIDSATHPIPWHEVAFIWGLSDGLDVLGSVVVEALRRQPAEPVWGKFRSHDDEELTYLTLVRAAAPYPDALALAKSSLLRQFPLDAVERIVILCLGRAMQRTWQ